MALSAAYLADKSALSRFPLPTVSARLGPLLIEGRLATCAIIDLEVLYSARDLRTYEDLLVERRSLPDIPITPKVMKRAIDVQHALARVGHHRLPIPDLVIAAAAESVDATVIHYDADFERIAGVTGQPHEWVVARGTI